MAYSPSPQTASLPGLATASRQNPHHHSQTPPHQQIISKRDKRRIAMADRLTEISISFAENRDVLYRKRMQGFQADINFINAANLYDNKPLDDFVGNATSNASPAPSVHGGPRNTQQAHLNGHFRYEHPVGTGKHAAKFIQEVNDALEKKDADLTTAACEYNFYIDQLNRDYKYSFALALEEHKRLTEALRQRLIHNVQSKKAALHRDKEKLDIADTNALLHHPTQFSINNIASPGGPQSNRKTRHTRHRLDAEDLETNNINHKRKRKLVETENGGSPTRDPAEVTNGYKANEARAEYHQLTAPLYTIDRLFSDKELNSHLQAATYDVLATYSAKRSRNNPTTTALPTNNSATDLEENHAPAIPDQPSLGADGSTDDLLLPAAPEMERTTTNQSYHATRSTRNVHIANCATRENLGELAGRQVAADMIGTFHKEGKKAADDYNRAPPVTELEGAEDLALMAKAMREEDLRREVDEGLLDEVNGETENWLGNGVIEGRDGEEDVSRREYSNGNA